MCLCVHADRVACQKSGEVQSFLQHPSGFKLDVKALLEHTEVVLLPEGISDEGLTRGGHQHLQRDHSKETSEHEK